MCTHVHLTTNASYDFVAPEISKDADEKVTTVFPTAEKQSIAYAATIAGKVERTTTVLDLGQLTGAATMNLTVGADVPVGALLLIKAGSDTTARDLTLGTKFGGPATLAGTISKNKSQLFMFDGTNFVATAAAVTLN